MKIFLILVLISFSFDVFSEEEIQLYAANTTKNVAINNNKLIYVLDLPPYTEAIIRAFIPKQANIRNVEIILSDGTVVTTNNAKKYHININFFEPTSAYDMFISPTKALIVSFGNAVSGKIKIKGNITGESPKTLPVNVKLIGGAIHFGSYYFPNSFIHANDDITFSQYIYEANGSPKNVANVELKVSQKGALLATHIMKDDGLLNDFKAGDGVFTKTISFSKHGKYTTEIESVIVDSAGFTHKNTDLKTVEVKPIPPFSLTGLFTEELIDSDDNGLADKLKIIFEYANVPKVGEKYHIQVVIGNDSTSYDQQRVNIDSDTSELAVEFSGLKIGKQHTDGPIKFTFIKVVDLNSRDVLEVNRTFGETKSYSYMQFERHLAIEYTKQAEVTLVDKNNDGIKEGLNIKFNMKVDLAGLYESCMTLSKGDDSYFDILERFKLEPGEHELNIFVPAQKLIRAKANGILTLKGFHFKPAKSWRVRIDKKEVTRVEKRGTFGITPAFSCEDFGGCAVQYNKPSTTFHGFCN